MNILITVEHGAIVQVAHNLPNAEEVEVTILDFDVADDYQAVTLDGDRVQPIHTTADFDPDWLEEIQEKLEACTETP